MDIDETSQPDPSTDDPFDEEDYDDDPIEDEEGEDECQGHESLRGDEMGLTVYCDGSCRGR